ncbi:hypothetical protein [Phreatobacter sp.]|uniref:hypothetical protein n=1 Tax=Phreatobacter sp. TaxID=1966341 RepID=UPI003F727AC7
MPPAVAFRVAATRTHAVGRTAARRPFAAPALPSLMLAAVLAVPALVGPAAARDAGCRIEQAGRVVLDRTCDFQPEGRDGSFTLSARGGADTPLFRGVSVVSVMVIEPGVADVRGLTTGGINSRWGTARRSGRDGACWQGDDFRICAR